ncbi:WcaI family glycosyltransferase [Rhizobium sp. SGZ-381]|uniref:WcaI family glycosyltransferase n=1 Tax=Rhizobium sp. SGZ-381 TaxID=3342800 RepID=UPI00366B2AD7
MDAQVESQTASVTNKRILIYGMNYAPELAGVGKYTGEIAEYLAAEGADVTVVSTPPHYPGWAVQKGYRNGYSTVKENGVHVLRTPLLLRRKMKGVWRLLAPLSFAASSAPVVFWQILRRRPEAVFCVEPTLFAAPVAQLAAKLVGARTVLHVQDLEVDAAFAVGHLGALGFLKKLGFAFERFTLKRFDKVITISNRMADKLVEKGVKPQNMALVRNWVDLSHIYPMTEESPYRAELGFTKSDFVVLYSGNIGAKQGLTVLLDAAEKLKGEANIHFVIAGEGPLKDELQARYGTLPNLRFLPFQPYARLNEFLNMADLHALPQDKGAADLVLPSKLGGMLACGKPVLVTADDGTELAEFARGVAIVVPPGDFDRLAHAIHECYKKCEKTDCRCPPRFLASLSKTSCVAAIKISLQHGMK